VLKISLVIAAKAVTPPTIPKAPKMSFIPEKALL
jgi:hypothetical protein